MWIALVSAVVVFALCVGIYKRTQRIKREKEEERKWKEDYNKSKILDRLYSDSRNTYIPPTKSKTSKSNLSSGGYSSEPNPYSPSSSIYPIITSCGSNSNDSGSHSSCGSDSSSSGSSCSSSSSCSSGSSCGSSCGGGGGCSS